MAGAKGDTIRGMQGYIRIVDSNPSQPSTGPFVNTGIAVGPETGTGQNYGAECYFDPSRVVPTGTTNSPRAWGALACVYLGVPATV